MIATGRVKLDVFAAARRQCQVVVCIVTNGVAIAKRNGASNSCARTGGNLCKFVVVVIKVYSTILIKLRYRFIVER